jgi:hypothetical protein
MRIRALLLAAATAAATAATLVLPAGPATAATPLTAAITCDSATETISTRLSGGLVPNFSYKLKFEAFQGSYVTTAKAMGVIPAKGSSITVPVTTGPDGNVSVAGYTRAWPAPNYLFYTETVRVHVMRASDGVEVMYRDATCVHDLRTTFRLDCDREAHAITAATEAVNYPADELLRVEHKTRTTYQYTPDSIRWTTELPTSSTTVRVPESGTWSDSRSTTINSDFYYYARQTTLVIKDYFSGLVVGGGSASCVYADQSSPGAAA